MAPRPAEWRRCVVSVVSMPATGPLAWNGQGRGRRMFSYTNGGVDAGTRIGWHLPPGDSVVSVIFGDEQITLDFHDVESLELLRDVADEGARRLREAKGACGGSR